MMGSGVSKKTENKPQVKNQKKQENAVTEVKPESIQAVTVLDDVNESEGGPEEGSEAAAAVTSLPAIDEDTGIVGDCEISYAEFPTHVTLRSANEKQAKQNKAKKSSKGPVATLQPFPSLSRKNDVFKIENFKKIDEHSDSVSSTESFHHHDWNLYRVFFRHLLIL